MKKRQLSFSLFCFGLFLLGLASGCSTPDGEALSERPWNAPKSWEHGIPQSMMEGR